MVVRDNDGFFKFCFVGFLSGSLNRFWGRGLVFFVDLGYICCYFFDVFLCKVVICVINFYVMCKGFFLIF